MKPKLWCRDERSSMWGSYVWKAILTIQLLNDIAMTETETDEASGSATGAIAFGVDIHPCVASRSQATEGANQAGLAKEGSAPAQGIEPAFVFGRSDVYEADGAREARELLERRRRYRCGYGRCGCQMHVVSN